MMAKIPKNHWIFTTNSCRTENSGEPAAIILSDTVFEFLSEVSAESSLGRGFDHDVEEENEEKENRNENENGDSEDNFWNGQYQLLQNKFFRIKAPAYYKGSVERIAADWKCCACGRRVDSGCRKCLMEEVCQRLHEAGFDSAICKSRWKSSYDLPAGEHTFLDVIDKSNPEKEIRVIIELNFRAEFEMARSSEEYNKLINRLPAVFVGKMERLQSLLKILCAGAKKCMKERKMHLGPWRKHRYMQTKWLRTCERKTSSVPLSLGYSTLLARPKLSMLTAEMMNKFSNLPRPVVQVV